MAALFSTNVLPAVAACSQGKAIYADRDGVAELAFHITVEAPAVSNSFTLTIDETVLDGIVMWTEDLPRPNGMLMLDCPEGDVTGEELEKCTSWQGVIYAADAHGSLGLLPAEDGAAAVSVILPDLAWSLTASASFGERHSGPAPFDIFALKGCAP